MEVEVARRREMPCLPNGGLDPARVHESSELIDPDGIPSIGRATRTSSFPRSARCGSTAPQKLKVRPVGTCRFQACDAGRLPCGYGSRIRPSLDYSVATSLYKPATANTHNPLYRRHQASSRLTFANAQDRHCYHYRHAISNGAHE
jgi:hypothetical protein